MDVSGAALRPSDLAPEASSIASAPRLAGDAASAWDTVMLGFHATPSTGAAASPLQDIPARRWLCAMFVLSPS